ncbi:MAG: Mo-dependent nitrogenase C-terminal domain-containing protein [Synechococcus sp.]|nr:Mo-dependent nitrogenase C-terminal domain-containing protein [Synechococcus sp.]
MIFFPLQQSPKNPNKPLTSPGTTAFDLLQPLRQWLNGLEIANAERARLICQLVPAQCPFAQEISLAGLIHFKIPPLCKLNPLYEEVVALRFRALCYLAENYPSEVCRYC